MNARSLEPSPGALSGLRVLDLSRVLAGPLCAQILADHGAEVLKIESDAGDDTRRLGRPQPDGAAPYFHALNRNKRGAVLDLASDAGRARLLELVDGADVVIENFIPGTMRKWGLDYETVLAPRNPRLVYCAITGFGADGPLGGMPGYDAIAQAVCGLMSVNGDPSTRATRVGVPVVDITTGMNAALGVLLALAERARSGRGQQVEATLFDSGLALLVPHAADYLQQGREYGRTGNSHPAIAPYQSLRTRDGEVFVGALNDRQFARLCACIGREELARDPRFASNEARVEHRDALSQALESGCAPLDAQPLADALMRAGVPAGCVMSVAQALTQPHATARGCVLEQDGWRMVRSPVRLGRTPATLRSLPPPLDPRADASWRDA